jgi:N-acetyl sugar amidotransferase
MDTSVIDIRFDNEGICNYCKEHELKVLMTPFSKERGTELNQIIKKVKSEKNGQYDSIVGLSGGVDSSYVAFQAVKLGLRPLAIHFDNGWNSELAVQNIENIVKRLDLDLITFVIDWSEFKDIQRSFFKANVIDIEMVTDHAIFAALYQIANKQKIRYILSGTNSATEAITPTTWSHFKFDLLNLRSIHRRFGTKSIKNYPTMSIWQMAWNHYIRGVKSISLLNHLPYRKDEAMRTLKEELGWQYYGGKHYESTFTKFYQAYILPKKFGVDKRRAHLSDLIMNGEITRDEALAELDLSLYDELQFERDRDYVCKKLGFSIEYFSSYMDAPAVSHFTYPSYAKLAQYLTNIYKKQFRRY